MTREAILKVRIDMTGERFGRLVGVAFSHRSRCGHAMWLFQCDCGGEVIASGTNVRLGNTTSCSCVHRELSAARLHKHGYRAGRRHGPTYRAWQMMNDACANPASPKFADCGARGIQVCDNWRGDFARFLDDLGERPRGTKLHRDDLTRDFAPGNCQWLPLAPNGRRVAASPPVARHNPSGNPSTMINLPQPGDSL